MKHKKHFNPFALLAMALAWLALPLQVRAESVPLALVPDDPGNNNVLVTPNEDGTFTIITTGGDPFVVTTALEADLAEGMNVLTLEYKVDSSTGSDFEIFFSPIVGGHSINKGGQPATEEWVTAYFDISGARKDWGWGKAGDYLRFDPATSGGITMQVRNLRVCTTADVIPEGFESENGMVLINNQSDFDRFIEAVNDGLTSLPAKFNSDVEVTGNALKIQKYTGVMDGQGHTINYDFTYETTGKGFICDLYGTIKNFKLEGIVNCPARGFGALATWAYGACIENVDNNLEIVSTYEGDNTSGGFIAWNQSGDNTIIRNSVFRGSIKSEVGVQFGGFVGWSSANELIENCLFIGDIDVVITPGDAYGTNVFSRGDNSGTCVTTKNCYYLNNPQDVNASCTQITEEQLTSGEVCFLLNGNQQAINWWQTIGTDAIPTPLKGNSKQVYANGELTCDGKIVGTATFNNTSGSELPPHNFTDGVCDVCGATDPGSVPAVEDGYYMVGTAGQLNYMSSLVNSSVIYAGVNIKLTADIDMSEIEGFMPLNSYKGTFDGQGHTISGLHISCPETDYVGLLGQVMPGCTLKNLTLAPDCVIEGKAFVGMIGGSAPSEGTITMTNLINHGSVIGGAQNAGGIIGCCMSSSATFLITNCGVTGMVKGANESAGISGWVGDKATIKNCWSIASVEGADNEASMFLRPNSTSLNNCYTTVGTQGTVLEETAVTNGELAWRLNGESFTSPVWYQTIEEDETPVLDATHGVVYKITDGVYGSVQDEASYKEFITAYVSAIENDLDEKVANRDAAAALKDALEELKALTSFQDFLAIYKESFEKIRGEFYTSADAYQAYMDKVEETRVYLEENPDLECQERDLLDSYINDNVDPCEDMPNGSYVYIVDAENRVLDTNQIKEETTRVEEMLKDAIRMGFFAGSDVTNLLVNANFSDGTNGWDGIKATGVATAEGIGACESWSTTKMDMYQTITGLKDGVYELSCSGGFRAFNDEHSYQYAAFIYANGIYNYLSSVRETMLLPEEAEDHVNCFLTGDSEDAATEREVKDGEGNLIGYAIHGRKSVCYAALAGRALNRVLVNVTNGELTVGVVNHHSFTSDNEWTGIGNIKLTYLGNLETDEPDMSNTLSDMLDRANTILNIYEFSADENINKYPNFSQDIRDRMTAVVGKAEAASSAAEQYACIEELSALFQEVLDCKVAYRALAAEVEVYNAIAAEAAASGEMDVAEAEKIYLLKDEVLEGYVNGTYTTQEATEMNMLQGIGIAPEKDENGVLHIASKVNFLYFVNMVNNGFKTLAASLETDIMNFTKENIIYAYAGSFEGNHHTIDVDITCDADNAAIFDDLAAGARVTNLNVTGVITTPAKYAAGLAAHTHNGAYVDGIHSSVIINSSINGDGTHAGIIAVCEEPTTIKNCLFDGQMIGANTTCCGGIVGWCSGNPVTIDGCLVIADIQVSASGSNMIARNPGYAKISNCYYTTPFADIPTGAAQISPDQFPTGEATYLLNGGRTSNIGWFQTLGTDDMPVLDATHKTVYRLPDGTYTNEPQSELDKHTGTQDDPFIITKPEEMASLRDYMRTGEYTYVKLGNDIDMSSITDWVPLNMEQDNAGGKAWMNWIDFDGQGHVIKNFTCTTGTQAYNSFFGILCGNVRNVGFENAYVSCINSGTGILGGYMGHDNFAIDGVKQTSTLEKVWVTGKCNIINDGNYAGGMIGNIGGPSIIRNCYAIVDLTAGNDFRGAIVGRVRDALTIENVYAAGNNAQETGIVGGGKKDETAPSTYKNIVVWCNTTGNFGTTTAEDTMEGISYYDGTNFAELQQTVVAWGAPWYCDMNEGSYPVFGEGGSAIDKIASDNQDARIYNINGIQVEKAQGGIFIIDGKKISVK
ncbi:MAG: hypothetical protein ACI3X9_04650 [Bacteroidaceae bacterium]